MTDTSLPRFLYDMGAGLNMMLSTDFVKDSSVLHRNENYMQKKQKDLVAR